MAKRRKLPAVDVAPKPDASKLCATNVPLRNGGKIVLESTSSTSELDLETERVEVTAYLTRVSAWFETEFGQLELFETDIASVAHRKMATFAQLTLTPEWAAPVKVEMRYESPDAGTAKRRGHTSASAKLRKLEHRSFQTPLASDWEHRRQLSGRRIFLRRGVAER